VGDRTGIEWTDATWTPIRARRFDPAKGKVRIGHHCEHVSEACRNCYAEGINRRLGTGLDYKPGYHDSGAVEVFLDEDMLTRPLRWKKPRMIFVCSMTDLFARFVTDEMIDKVFAVMALCPQHTFQVLTKRPERMRAYFRGLDERCFHQNDYLTTPWARRDSVAKMIGEIALSVGKPDLLGKVKQLPLPNVWLGTSVEDQATADERIPELLATPAAVRFVSAEPLLGPVDLYNGDPDPRLNGHRASKTFIGEWWEPGDGSKAPPRRGVDWVIAGGESGPSARPCHPDWARSLRDQCAAAGVPFFWKQWGEFAPFDAPTTPYAKVIAEIQIDGTERCTNFGTPQGALMSRVGKKAAGALLDGKEHREFPA